MADRCWGSRAGAWDRLRPEFRCQRRYGHSRLHSHKYSDGKLEWDESGKEYLNRKESSLIKQSDKEGVKRV